MSKIDTSIERAFGVYRRHIRKVVKETTGDFVSEIVGYKRDTMTYLADGSIEFGSGSKTWEYNTKTGKVRYLSSHGGSDNEVTVNIEKGIIYISQTVLFGVRAGLCIYVHPSEII